MTDLMENLYEFLIRQRVDALLANTEYPDFAACQALQEENSGRYWMRTEKNTWIPCSWSCPISTPQNWRLCFRPLSSCAGS